MASGGRKNPKTSSSEPRQKSTWTRTTSMSDKDDNVSLNSFANDLRPNNWDFSDWQPSGAKDQTKRRKKGNPEWEREQSLSMESPPPPERQHGTPRTFPRTKITPTTPTSQRIALENLKQQMTFSDQEDGASNDGEQERNNDRNLLRRRENVASNNRGQDRLEPPRSRPVPNQREDRSNRNNNKQNQGNEARSAPPSAAAAGASAIQSKKPDSSQIVGRLMQIREYIKQTNAMMESLKKSGDPDDRKRSCDLSQSISFLKEFESECLQSLWVMWPGYRDEMNRLQKLRDHLKEQESGYTGLLQAILSVKDEPDVNDASREFTPNPDMDDTTSVDLDVQSEISDREERSVSASSRPRIEDKLGIATDNDEEEEEVEEEIVENGAPSESSNDSSTMDDTVIANRELINQAMGYTLGDEEYGAFDGQTSEQVETLLALRQQQDLLQKLVEQQEQMRALRNRQAALLALQQDAEAKLATTRQKSNEARAISIALDDQAGSMAGHVDALSLGESNAGRPTDPDLMDIRQQLQYLRNELSTQDANLKQVQSQNAPLERNAKQNQASKQQETKAKKNAPPPRPPSPKLRDRPSRSSQGAAGGAVAVPDRSIPPEQLTREQLEARLQDLLSKKNRLDQMLQDEFTVPLMPTRSEDMSREQLANKLQELQNKKRRMDDMLKELQTLRANPAFTLNNAVRGVGGAAAQAVAPQPQARDPVAESGEGTQELTNGVLGVLDARQKLQKLNEVKSRLSQLKSLVHYYQDTGPGALQMEGEDQSSLPAYSDYGGEPEVTRDRDAVPVQESSKKQPGVNIPVRNIADSDENNDSASQSESESESQMSSLGPWGDDPEIQEKVRKLKAAKEKLKHLQSLVAIVQDSPGMAEGLPEELAELAASMEEADTQTEDRNNASTSEGEIPAAEQQRQRDEYYQRKMEEQMKELEDLKTEKTRLLTIQSQLQSLHDRFSQAEEEGEKQGSESGDEVRAKSQTSEQSTGQQPLTSGPTSQHNSGGPSVTFSSNEEVYYKMRNQRMLREELREKKKQLESIMKKDRNKKQYYKNQDNQSDTVSYSTELFGASVDQTMATWGGSTVDNMESITEDGAVQDNDEDEDEDDAYPVDGILQVEEEEEQNQSDNETYTIDDDVRERRKARSMAKGDNPDDSPKKGAKRSFPRSGRQTQGGTGPKEAWTKPTDFNKWSRNGRKSRQENYRSAEDIVQDSEENPKTKSAIEDLQRKLEETSKLCQSLLAEQQGTGQLARQQAAGFGSHGQMLDLQQQLQQQQLMMSLNQCYQQISMQQLEMQNMQRQIQALLYQQADTSDSHEGVFSSNVRARSLSSLYSPMLPRQSPNILLPLDPFQANPSFMGMSSPFGSRLLRRAGDTEQRAEASEGVDKQTRTSRSSRTDSYSQKTKRKSQSQSPVQPVQIQTRSRGSMTELYAEQVEEEEEETANRFSPDRQKFEDYLAQKKREFLERNKLQDRSQKQTPDKGQRGSRSEDEYRPGLSAGISGAGYVEDDRSVVSSVRSSQAAALQAGQAQARVAEAARDSDDQEDMTLFETLRETIYSEVATLISQNENRPHYLIELFRELQLLTTDYLRQRVLYDIKDVVSKYLVEDTAVSAPPPRWMNTAEAQNFITSELTPSESIVTSDDEEVKYLLQMKLKQKVAANLVAKEREREKSGQTQGKGQSRGQLLRSGSMKNDQFDYQEPADEDSSVSTPSNSYWDSPFNQDSLGETVVHLDKTLKKMREYEEGLAAMNTKAKSQTRERSEQEKSDVAEAAAKRGDTERGEVSSSAMDQGDESSVNSDAVPYPRIDTQQLDQQIKSIMTEVIPVIKEHMDNMCSPQLLAYVKRLVLSLTRQYDSGQEFARFFHRQLGSILQDTLAKYEGRKMRECGEDLLVDMSEVLFNELAFFRLMQDLDNPLIKEKMKNAEAMNSEDDVEENEEGDKNASDNESDTTESSTANASDNEDDVRPTQTEEEELGKSRDDDLANEVDMYDDKDDDDSPNKGVQIELAPSETKPYSRIGSDEDDESVDEDESQSNEDPSETAVSINARSEYNMHARAGCWRDGEDQGGDSGSDMGSNPAREFRSLPSVGQAVSASPEQDADQGAEGRKAELVESLEHMNGDILNGDMEIITMDDLPPSMLVMSSAELQNKMANEQEGNTGAAALLGMMEGMQELAGDPLFLKEPDDGSG
ncbi:pericentriolar material 1 protein-like isoform X2 [Dreissena polymorpha]|uniref:Pericentriolar material 1 protein C-terminal domain-containing protein n=1 Tax=Dreissena polymorpha TaxID=45954 RepID=A0A9D4H7B7_DREPO|nr:pericentriolar material 1 protein-like isoform X2 [Dreissena polymorpha]KAH3829898.1 hypothetical protein DPMN_103129 [Dreissena polymorpha]